MLERRVSLPQADRKVVLASKPAEAQPKGTAFLEVVGALLGSSSPRLQIEACLALEPFASAHRVSMCQARVVGALIALTHSSDEEVQDTAGRVLRLLA